MANKEASSTQNGETLSKRNCLSTASAEPDRCCVHETIQKTCLSQPHAQAVHAWNGSFSYEELDRLSSSLADRLIELAIGPETYVPLCFEKSRWTVVAMLGVMKAGAAFVLLDASHPAARLKEVCQGAAAKLVLTSAQNAELAEGLADQKIVIGDGQDLRGKSTETLQRPQIQKSSKPKANNALYAVFTSGSTGAPKGVVMEHDSFHSVVEPYSAAIKLDHNSRVFLFASYAFDVCIFDTLSALIVGGCVCVPSENDRWTDLAKSMTAFRVTHASLTPKIAKIIDPADVPTVTTLVLGGEKMPKAEIARWIDHGKVVELYGASECPLVLMTEYRMKEDNQLDEIRHRTGSTCWIVDPENHDALTSTGVEGELLVQGNAIGRGYLNDSIKSAAVFISLRPRWATSSHDTKIDNVGPSKFYKTGDLARFTAGGSVQILGRKDNQVKLRGQRIELDEVERHVKSAFHGAGDVVADVVTPADPTRSAFLTAFVCWNNGRMNKDSGHHSNYGTALDDISTTPDDVFSSKIADAKSRLGSGLPSYMIPSAFIPLQSIPLNRNSKTDRRRLREWAARLSQVDLDLVQGIEIERRAPTTSTEEKIQKLWAQVLGVDVATIGVDDNFLRVGGDSIIAMRIATEAQRQSVNISARDILASETIARIAEQADAAGSQEPAADEEEEALPFSLLDAEKPTIDDVVRKSIGHFSLSENLVVEDVFPFTPLQEYFRLCQIEHTQSLSMVTTWKVTVRTCGAEGSQSIDINRLKAAWEQVVSRHQMLRALPIRVGWPDTTAVNIVFKDVTPQIRVLETETLEHFLTLPEVTDFNFNRGLPHQAYICKTNADEIYFGWKTSHLIYDGQSINILIHDLAEAYDGQLLPASCPPLYRDFVANCRQNAIVNDSLAYWTSYSKDLKPCCIRPQPSSKETSAADPVPRFELEHTMDAEMTASVKFFCKTYGVTIANILHVAWKLVLKTYTNSDTVCFSYITANRGLPVRGGDEMVGLLIDYPVNRSVLHESSTLLDLLGEDRETLHQNSIHQTCDLEKIFHLKEGQAQLPFDTMVNVIKTNDVSSKARLDFSTVSMKALPEITLYAMLVAFVEVDEILLKLVFVNSYAPHEVPKRVFARLVAGVQAVLSKPECTVGSAEVAVRNIDPRFE